MTNEQVTIYRPASADFSRDSAPLEMVALADYERLRAAAYQACSDMGCFCPEGVDGICPMCRLEKALNG